MRYSIPPAYSGSTPAPLRTYWSEAQTTSAGTICSEGAVALLWVPYGCLSSSLSVSLKAASTLHTNQSHFISFTPSHDHRWVSERRWTGKLRVFTTRWGTTATAMLTPCTKPPVHLPRFTLNCDQDLNSITPKPEGAIHRFTTGNQGLRLGCLMEPTEPHHLLRAERQFWRPQTGRPASSCCSSNPGGEQHTTGSATRHNTVDWKHV